MKFWKHSLHAAALCGMAIGAHAATDVTTCQTISLRGSYRLTQNLETTGVGCITILSSNVTLDTGSQQPRTEKEGRLLKRLRRSARPRRP